MITKVVIVGGLLTTVVLSNDSMRNGISWLIRGVFRVGGTILENMRGEKKIRIEEIFYSQDSISPRFRNGKFLNTCIRNAIINGQSFFDRDGFLPIEVVRRCNRYYSIDNRRLYCMKEFSDLQGESFLVRCKIVKDGTEKINRKFTTINEGTSVRVRN